jgi:hypothetical protein
VTASLYLPVVTAKDVRDALKTTIGLWADVYTDELGRQKGIVLPPIKRYGVSGDPGLPAEEYPACVIVCPGLAGDPERHGDGTFTAPWAVGVGIVVKDLTIDRATDVTDVYIAALRALLVQQGSLGGFAAETTWLDEEIAPLAFERDAAVVAGSLQFRVLVPDVICRFGGPTTPPADPDVPVIPPAVTHTGVDVRNLT